MTRAEPVPESPKDAAGRWWSLRRSGAMSAQDVREFQVWLDREPGRRQAYDEIERMWAVAGALRADPEMMAIRESARRAYPRKPSIAMGAIAASVAAVAVSGWALMASGALKGLFAPVEQQAFHTGVGQRTTVELPDGSVVTLDTDTLLRTRLTGRKREVTLERGQAFFKVAKDASRPFVVAADGKTVTATGTAFEVRVDPGRFEVVLTQGRVRVEEPRGQFRRGQYADMIAGWRLTARNERDWKIAQADVAADTSWLSGRLTFNNRPLAEVAAELNRYSERKIVIRDASISGAPIVGVFDAGDVDGFAKLVTGMKLARVSNRTAGSVELAAR